MLCQTLEILGDIERALPCIEELTATPGAPGSADENANRLLRLYLAKGADLRQFCPRDLDDIPMDQHRATARTRLGHTG